MSVTATPATPSEVFYPESDGKPMAENTLQLDWILKLVGNLKVLVADRPDVFAAGNQNWYPVQGHPEIVQAPDAYVVFGRPKGFRPSWKQWEENNTPMTVVFEVRSPSNTTPEMADKLEWYSLYGVEEYYDFDPDTNHLTVYRRRGTTLVGVDPAHGHVSPRLGISFDLSGDEMVVRYPDGRPFLSMVELDQQRHAAEQRADEAEKQLDEAQKRAARLAELTQKALLQQATTEEQQELRALMAALLKP